MSFGGAVSSMITSLKNNKIKKRKFNEGFKDIEGSPVNVKPLIFKNKLSKEEFDKFSKELVDKKKKSILVQGIVYGSCFIVMLIILSIYL